MMMTVIEYVTEEVERQGHNTKVRDGIERVGWMLNAWCYALRSGICAISIDDILKIGQLIEPEANQFAPRQFHVRVGNFPLPGPHLVRGLLLDLIEKRDTLKPFEFYRELLEIHPFVDGNGRTGKVILNWLNGTLDNPIFPPNDFWGRPIRNP